ncbi:sigma-70 family RNA polymerase sigma factor, partial [Pantoea sp. SIMBA_079]
LRLETRRYTGDEAASDLIIDLKEAIRLAKLTDKQRDVLQLHYVYGYKQREIGAQLGIERSVVSRHLLAAEKKITKVYARWSKLDRIGGYSI